MAGVYPDVPGVRLPYDVDGTVAKSALTVSDTNNTISGSWVAVPSADLNAANDGSVTSGGISFTHGGYSGRMFALAFPQPVNISGHNIVCYQSDNLIAASEIYYSTDTNDGTDGTWSAAQPTSANYQSSVQSTLRDITSVSWNGIKGIRLWVNGWAGGRVLEFRDLAFYGTWASPGLMGWHPTLNQQIGGADLDVGDVPLGTVHTKTFRIKNQNAKIANNVLVASTRGVASTVAGLTFSTDNTNWSTTVTLTSIAAGAISPVLYVRRTIGAGETANIPGIAQITFTAGSWT